MAHQNWKCPTEMKSKGHLTHWEQETFVKHWWPLPSPTYKNMLHLHVWPWPTDLNIDRDHLLIKSYLPTKFEGSGADCMELSVAQGYAQHDLWPTDLNIYRDHLVIKNYVSTKFKASGTKSSWVIHVCCTRTHAQHDLSSWPLTYWPEYQ